MNEKINLKDRIIAIAVATLAIILVFGIFIAISYIVNKDKPLSPEKTLLPSQYPDYDTIKGDNPDLNLKKLDITASCPNGGCINHQSAIIDFDGIHNNYLVRGKFSRAYLYIEALVDYNRPLTSWDDFYFKMNGMGGHLVSSEDNSLPVPPSTDSKYLYDLRSMSYFSSPTEKIKGTNEHKNINLFNLLQASAELKIDVSLSSARPGRVMKEVSIYYECTESSDCDIQEIKK